METHGCTNIVCWDPQFNLLMKINLQLSRKPFQGDQKRFEQESQNSCSLLPQASSEKICQHQDFADTSFLKLSGAQPTLATH